MVRQLSLERWPVGLEQDVAVLNLVPSEISRRAGITFERAYDSLDDFDGAVVQLDGDKLLALQHYLHSPSQGTKLVLQSGSVSGLQEAVGLLDLKRSEISWIAPQVSDEMEAALRAHSVGSVGRTVTGQLLTRIMNLIATRLRRDEKDKVPH